LAVLAPLSSTYEAKGEVGRGLGGFKTWQKLKYHILQGERPGGLPRSAWARGMQEPAE